MSFAAAQTLLPLLSATLYGVMTLFQTPGHPLPEGPARMAWFKSWIDQSAVIGAQVIRIPGDWRSLEEQGRDQWSQWYVDEAIELVRYAGQQNIKVIYEFAQTPDWAKPPGRDDGLWTNPQDPRDFGKAAAYLQSRFMAAGVSRYIAAWEVWNEPNVKTFWPGGRYRNPGRVADGADTAVDEAAARQYVGLLNAAYDALKAVDPGVTVLGGSLAGTDFEYADWMHKGGAHFDGLSVHPYTRPFANGPTPARPGDDPAKFPEGPDLSDTLNERWSFQYGMERLHAELERAGQNGDLWITELGWKIRSPTAGWGYVPDEKAQADYLGEALQLINGWGFVRAVTWFQLYDADDGDFGLLKPDGSWRLSAHVLHDFITGQSLRR
jgi:hypothetical protein